MYAVTGKQAPARACVSSSYDVTVLLLLLLLHLAGLTSISGRQQHLPAISSFNAGSLSDGTPPSLASPSPSYSEPLPTSSNLAAVAAAAAGTSAGPRAAGEAPGAASLGSSRLTPQGSEVRGGRRACCFAESELEQVFCFPMQCSV